MSTRAPKSWFVPCLAILLVGVGTVRAEEPADARTLAEREAAGVHEWTARMAGRIDVRVPAADSGTEAIRLAHTEKPLLKWSLPEVGRVYGDVYVWSHRGRPRAIASLYEWFHPHTGRTVEWVSVSNRPLLAELDGRELWRTGPAGVEWQPIPSSPPPHRSATGRLLQMRSIARRFSARLHDDRTDEKGVEKPLRLLTAPLHRYASPEEKVLDGGVFTFVLGSDPEVLLLVEARESEGDGAAQWQALVARMNSSPVTVWRDDAELERFDAVPLDDLWDRTRPYCLVEPTPGGGT